jgi:MoaA/NifB/PqqE/SkfB family radical SAM enzyme
MERTMFENRDDLLEKLREAHVADFPGMIPIDNVSLCNLRCSMCNRDTMKRRPGIMERRLYEKIIDEVALEQPDTKLWMNFFGEPTLLKDIPDRISYAIEKGCTNVSINSNGNLLTPEVSERYIKAGLVYAYVGIDAFTQETYAKLRVKGDLQRVVSNVLAYRDLLKKHGDGNQRLFVQFVVMDENTHELDRFLEFWNGHGITVKTRPKVTWINSIKPSTKGLAREVERFPCPWMIETMSIMHDGRVALCALDSDGVRVIGDVNERSIKDIWDGAHRELREHFMENRGLPEVCVECPDWVGKLAVYNE